MNALSKISDFADVYAGGGAPQNANDFSEDGIPFLRAGSLPKLLTGAKESDLEKITNDVAKRHRLQLHKKGSVVFAKSGMSATKGHIYRLKNDCYVVNHLAVVTPNPICDSKYLEHALKKYTPTSLILDAAYPSIRLSDICNFKIPLPPLAEQQRIAAILDKAAEIKAKREQAIAKLDELAQSMFVEMFGSPINNKSWKNEILENLCTKITDGTHHSPNIEVDGVPYITAKHLKADGLDFFGNPWFVSKAAHDEIYKRCDPKKGDVLYIKDGATTGVAAINNYDFEFSMLSSLALIRVNKERLNSAYLCYWLNNPIVKQNLLGFMSGAAIQRFTLAKIKKFSLPLPPIALQIEFEEHITKIKQNHSKCSLALLAQEKLVSSLQHQAFTTGFNA